MYSSRERGRLSPMPCHDRPSMKTLVHKPATYVNPGCCSNNLARPLIAGSISVFLLSLRWPYCQSSLFQRSWRTSPLARLCSPVSGLDSLIFLRSHNRSEDRTPSSPTMPWLHSKNICREPKCRIRFDRTRSCSAQPRCVRGSDANSNTRVDHSSPGDNTRACTSPSSGRESTELAGRVRERKHPAPPSLPWLTENT